MPPGEPLFRPDWVVDNLDVIGQRLGEHVGMTATAVIVGFLISFALALLIRRRRTLTTAVIGTAGILYAIPSLALFAFLIPFTGISFKSGFASVIAWIVWPRTFQRFNSKSDHEHFGRCRRTTG